VRTSRGWSGSAAIAFMLILGTSMTVSTPVVAAVTCLQDEFGQPFVTLTASLDRVTLRVGAGGALTYDPGTGFVPCGTATMTSTETITVNDQSSGATQLIIDLSGGPFAPGFSTEGGASPEVEFAVNLGESPGDDTLLDLVRVRGTSASDPLAAGTDGINLNPTEGAGVDADVILQGMEGLILEGLEGDDIIRMDGGFGTGTDVAGLRLAHIYGGPDEDRTIGSDAMGSTARRCEFVEFPVFVSVEGPAAECHFGLGGADHLNGGGGRDSLFGGPGADRVQGFGGRDRVEGDSGPDILTGNDNDDRLLGETGSDRLIAGSGDDVLEGGPGDDRCQGGTGRDRFFGCEFA
jgi:Ca2+-binding RTX toxin-like protein